MPLIMVVGIPCSGKTTRAKELEQFFKQQSKSVVVFSDDDILPDKNKAYKDSYNEKETRAKVKAAVERDIMKDMVVIADSTNYIKGYRYELYCASRSARTPHCVLFCDTPVELAAQWNLARKNNSQPFDTQLLQELAMRMEVPNEARKWDKPLFTVKPTDATPCQAIFDALLSDKAHKPSVNQATLPQKLADSTLLYELDKITNEIIQHALDNKSTFMPGDKTSVPKTTEKLVIPQLNRLTLSELRKLRTNFLKLSQMHPPSSVNDIGKLFVVYLNTQFKL